MEAGHLHGLDEVEMEEEEMCTLTPSESQGFGVAAGRVSNPSCRVTPFIFCWTALIPNVVDGICWPRGVVYEYCDENMVGRYGKDVGV
jgi:hypothetical protein